MIPIFKQSEVPIFQNKVYDSIDKALKARTGDVSLIQSPKTGLVYNQHFDPSVMAYDESYNNEQASSEVFKEHLDQVLSLLIKLGIKDRKVVEVGCGKGVFFEKMLQAGIDCYGFDPTYEGDNPRIVKEYFDESKGHIGAEVIVMRHTLEHIPDPYNFIELLGRSNGFKGKLFVEVPSFDWILEKGSFWDIFYEHCNYFTEQSLSNSFSIATTGTLFGRQYIYLWADLSSFDNSRNQNIRLYNSVQFEKELSYYEAFISRKASIAIWGAGAKGSTFLNLLDQHKEKVNCVVDINPKKQGKFIGGTAHPIIGPSAIDQRGINNVLVMNNNYFDEVKSLLNGKNVKIDTL